MSDIVDSLTRTKKTKKSLLSITEAVIPQPVPIPVVEQVVPVDVPVKVKKPRSEAQIAAFAKTAQRRQEKIALNKQAKMVTKAKAVLENNGHPIKSKPVPKPVEDSDSEVEIVVKKKKPKYKIVVEESSSDESDTESESEAEPIKPTPPTRTFSSQQNRKSKITVHKPVNNYNDCFRD